MSIFNRIDKFKEFFPDEYFEEDQIEPSNESLIRVVNNTCIPLSGNCEIFNNDTLLDI